MIETFINKEVYALFTVKQTTILPWLLALALAQPAAAESSAEYRGNIDVERFGTLESTDPTRNFIGDYTLVVRPSIVTLGLRTIFGNDHPETENQFYGFTGLFGLNTNLRPLLGAHYSTVDDAVVEGGLHPLLGSVRIDGVASTEGFFGGVTTQPEAPRGAGFNYNTQGSTLGGHAWTTFAENNDILTAAIAGTYPLQNGTDTQKAVDQDSVKTLQPTVTGSLAFFRQKQEWLTLRDAIGALASGTYAPQDGQWSGELLVGDSPGRRGQLFPEFCPRDMRYRLPNVALTSSFLSEAPDAYVTPPLALYVRDWGIKATAWNSGQDWSVEGTRRVLGDWFGSLGAKDENLGIETRVGVTNKDPWGAVSAEIVVTPQHGERIPVGRVNYTQRF